MSLHGLPPIDPPGARILVLGSFPSRQSLEKSEYYGNERNHFWVLMSACLGLEFPDDYPARRDALERAGVAVWDVVASCERSGSLDADIRAAVMNPILPFIAKRPYLSRIALNGAAAAGLFVRGCCGELEAIALGVSARWQPAALSGRVLLVARLPSSSPIPTRDFRTAQDKLKLWKSFVQNGRNR